MAKQQHAIHFGLHVVTQTLESCPEVILELWVSDSRKPSAQLDKIIQLAKRHGISIQRVHTSVLDKLTGEKNHQGIAMRRLPPKAGNEDDLLNLLEKDHDRPLLFLILDGVQDPHNLGACLRTADAAGVDAVIVPRNNAAGLNATVSKVASGAAERVPFIQVTNLARTMRAMQDANVWLIGTDDAAEKDLYSVRLQGNIAIVMGAEGKGLRENTQKHCDERVFLPMLGSVESLNVSVAAGICLYEVLRQRK